jgi:hypothetical protein
MRDLIGLLDDSFNKDVSVMYSQKRVGWIVAAVLALLPLGIHAENKADKEYRHLTMRIAQNHIKALDSILSSKVDHIAHVEFHARGLRRASQMFPHKLPRAMLADSDPAKTAAKHQR